MGVWHMGRIARKNGAKGWRERMARKDGAKEWRGSQNLGGGGELRGGGG